MITWGWWTRGAESAATQPEEVHQWAYDTQGRHLRIYPPRTRDDVWVMPGDFRHDEPARDTWEGEAT